MGEIDCTTRSSPGHPGESDFSLIGDYGWPRVPRDSPSLSSRGRAEHWPVCPLIDVFFSVSGTSQVSLTERQSSWPNVYVFMTTSTITTNMALFSLKIISSMQKIIKVRLYIPVRWIYDCMTFHACARTVTCMVARSSYYIHKNHQT